MEDVFQPPPWVTAPKLENCGLKVRKEGKVISIVTDLNKKKFLTLGRNAKMSDIRLDHPSISRRHAMFAHGSSGNVYVMDLGSSHGTFVNNKRLTNKKREALHDGDVVRFGASTREYIVKLDLDSPDEKPEIQPPPNKKQKLADNTSKDMHDDENEQSTHAKTSSVIVNKIDDKDNNNNNNSDPSEVSCRHLLIKHKDSRRPNSWKEDAIVRTKDQALQMCQEFRKEILKSDNIDAKFSALAKVESDCNSAKRGGDLGKFRRGKMQKPFEDAAFALAIGELSEPVDTDSGIHLILRTG